MSLGFGQIALSKARQSKAGVRGRRLRHQALLLCFAPESLAGFSCQLQFAADHAAYPEPVIGSEVLRIVCSRSELLDSEEGGLCFFRAEALGPHHSLAVAGL